MRRWRWDRVVALVLGVALGAAVVGAAWLAVARTEGERGVVDVGAFAEFQAYGQFQPVLYASHAFYLVKTDAGEPRALYAYPLYAQFAGRRGCAVEWYEQVAGWEAVFRERCGGSTFSRDGAQVFGPGGRHLDQFRVEVRDGRILVDTRRLLCEGAGPCRRVR